MATGQGRDVGKRDGAGDLSAGAGEGLGKGSAIVLILAFTIICKHDVAPT